MKTSPLFYFPNTESGRKQYLSEVENLIKGMNENLSRLLTMRPNIDLIVKSVEPFREKSAGLAFYEGPSEDGRLGRRPEHAQHESTAKMGDGSSRRITKACQATIRKIAIATQLKGLPRFLCYTSSTAFIEGWYFMPSIFLKNSAATVTFDQILGVFRWSFGRACRLVVDTGIHFQSGPGNRRFST